MWAALAPFAPILLAAGALAVLVPEIGEAFEDTFGPVVDNFEKIGKQLVELFGGMENLKTLGAVALAPIAAMLKSMAFFIGVISAGISELIVFIQNVIDEFERLADKIPSLGVTVGVSGRKTQGKIESALGIDLGFAKFAAGGIGSGFQPGIISQPTFNTAGNQMAGEAGAEAIIPLKDGAVPVVIQGGASSNQPMQVNVTLDGKVLGRALFDLSQRKAMNFDPRALLNRGSI
jgi:hypothetical protein